MKSRKDRKSVRNELGLNVIMANSTPKREGATLCHCLRAGHQEARRTALFCLLPLSLSGDMSMIRFES